MGKYVVVHIVGSLKTIKVTILASYLSPDDLLGHRFSFLPQSAPTTPSTCTAVNPCGEGEGVCEVGSEISGCVSGFECASCLCGPNINNNCPEGQVEFNCCTSILN